MRLITVAETTKYSETIQKVFCNAIVLTYSLLPRPLPPAAGTAFQQGFVPAGGPSLAERRSPRTEGSGPSFDSVITSLFLAVIFLKFKLLL